MRIGIIGPIGVGKSKIAKQLADHYGWPMLDEPVVSNEYLPYFYADKKTFAMLSQNAFYSAMFLEMWKLKDEVDLICDSTVYSNLVFTELLRLEGFMTASEVALTYAIADEHLKRIPDLDLQVVLMRSNEALFKNVRQRDRTIEKGQEEYLTFHYNNYYKVLRRLYDHYHVSEKKVLWLPVGDLNDEKEFARVIGEIERAYQQSLE